MLSTLSSNVVLSKARAMYGRRLKKQNFQDLLGCQTVTEVAQYLKNNTDYDKILSGANESTIHRGQLEIRLKQKLFEDSAALCRYELSIGEHFAQYLLGRSETEQIMHSLMLLNAGKPQEYLFAVPMFLVSHSQIDLLSLANVKSFDDVLAALHNTPYRRILEPFRPTDGVPLNYPGIETALDSYLFQSLYGIIGRYTVGETKKQLYEIFDSYLDLYNYVRIIRLKTFYHAGPDYIRGLLLPFGSLKASQVEKMLAAADADGVREIMENTLSGKRALKVEHSYPSEIAMRSVYRICRHAIHFSPHPPVVMLSYILLTQIELMDIINIIEGIRYQLPAKEIQELLTVINFQ